MTLQTVLVGHTPYLWVRRLEETHRLSLHSDKHFLGRDAALVDLVVPEGWTAVSNYHAVILREEDGHYWIYDGLNPQTHRPSTNGLLFKNRRITLTEGHCLQPGDEIQIGQNPETQVLLQYIDPLVAAIAPADRSGQRDVSLAKRSVVIGRDPAANLPLNSPVVSWKHAIIDTNDRGEYVIEDRSTNGTFVDGQRVSGSMVLRDGAIVQIGPFRLIRRGDRLMLTDLGDNIRLDAVGLSLPGREPKSLRVNDVTLPVDAGQVVALVGGSGAGKSSLMKALLGIESPSAGVVYLNGDNLRQNFNAYRNQIGYVPQDDILHFELTVQEALTYTARLRLPPDTSPADIKATINKVLTAVDMSHETHKQVGKLSGGQRKRVSIAAELLADPKLFFLDEPTSGLDPGLDKKMMELLRNLASDNGRTVVLVTHATANINLCDRVAFLGRGGRLCYFGPPQEALEFFGLSDSQDNFADIYIQLEPGKERETERAVAHWSKAFRGSDQYRKFVDGYLMRPGSHLTQQSSGSGSQTVTRSPLRQWLTLCDRHFHLLLRDPLNLAISLLTAPIAIGLVALALRDRAALTGPEILDPGSAPLALRVLFVFVCAALWVGLSGSIQEIVRENSIYARERLVNLGLLPYFGSKLTVLGGLALAQTLLMTGAIAIAFAAPTSDLVPWLLGMAASTFLTLLGSIGLGLAVSAAVKTTAQANTLLPLLLLPQIVFSGVLFKMEGIGNVISWFTLGRWAVGSYGILTQINALVPEPIKLPDGSTVPLPFETTPVYDATWDNLALNWGVLMVHLGACVIAALILQRQKDTA